MKSDPKELRAREHVPAGPVRLRRTHKTASVWLAWLDHDRVLGIYSTREKAEQAIREHGVMKDPFEVEEWGLDETRIRKQR